MSLLANKMAPFLLGIAIGFCLTSIFKMDSFEHITRNLYECHVQPIYSKLMKNNTTLPSTTKESRGNLSRNSDFPGVQVDDSFAKKLGKEIRVVCWVMTRPVNVTHKLNTIRKTWGKRCNTLLYFSSENNTLTGTIGLPNTAEGRDWLWAKTKEAFKYIYKNHLNDGDWFLKADDDTYFIMENLRYLLSGRDPTKPTYFGCRFLDTNDLKSQGYMSGGAGYILSKESLIRFVEVSLRNPSLCYEKNSGPEDLMMGKCLENVGVVAMDSRDSLGRHKFLPFRPYHQLNLKVGIVKWYWEMMYYPQKVGDKCCSDYAISYHYVSWKEMIEMEYFIYHLRVFGVSLVYSNPVVDENSIA